MASIWGSSTYCAPALIPMLFSRLRAGTGATVGLWEGTLMPGSVRHLPLRKHSSPLLLLGFIAGWISQPLGRRARHSEWLLIIALPPLVVSVDEKYVALGSLLRRIRSGWVHVLFFYLPQWGEWEGWSWCVWLVCSIAEPGIWKAEKCILFLHERFMISFFIALLCPQAAWFFFFPWGKNSLSSLFFFTN